MKNDSSRFGHIIQLFTVLLTAILISLFFAALVLVGKIQGTARVIWEMVIRSVNSDWESHGWSWTTWFWIRGMAA